jgi:hypothetical protein
LNEQHVCSRLTSPERNGINLDGRKGDKEHKGFKIQNLMDEVSVSDHKDADKRKLLDTLWNEPAGLAPKNSILKA